MYLYIVGIDYYVWIGGLRATKYFTWVNSGIPFPYMYQYWDDGQPNDYNEVQDCVHLEPNRRWNDEQCMNNMSYVCEYFLN